MENEKKHQRSLANIFYLPHVFNLCTQPLLVTANLPFLICSPPHLSLDIITTLVKDGICYRHFVRAFFMVFCLRLYFCLPEPPLFSFSVYFQVLDLRWSVTETSQNT